MSVNENYGVYQFYGNPDGREGGSLNLEILKGRGGSSSFGNLGGRGSQKTMPSIVGVWIISGITNSITC